MAKSIFHRHPVITLGTVTSVMCLGALFAVEALLAWGKPDPGTSSHRAIRLREHKPGIDEVIPLPETLIRDRDSLPHDNVRLRVDRDGFIEPSRVHDDPDFTVVFLGGSTTECLWVQEDSRFPYVTGRLLEERGVYQRVNSINAGRSANHSMHSIAALLGKVVPMQPDVCVMMHNCNDLMVLLQRQDYWNTKIAYRNMIETRRAHETVWTRSKDLVRQVFPNVIELFSPAQVVDDLAEVRVGESRLDRVFVETNFRRSLTTFIDLCRTWGIRPVLMTQANRITDEPDPQFADLPQTLRRDFGLEYAEYHALYHWMNELIRTVGREQSVPVVDLATIPQTLEFIYDPYHLNDRGSRQAAGLIADVLAAMRG